MQAFEKLAADLLWREGYWTTTAYKVDLTREEKRAIGRPTTPRWEIDVVAYNSAANEVIAVECKSYLDSVGVRMAHFTGQRDRFAARFKLFNEPETRKVVLRRLVSLGLPDHPADHALDVGALAIGQLVPVYVNRTYLVG